MMPLLRNIIRQSIEGRFMLRKGSVKGRCLRGAKGDYHSGAADGYLRIYDIGSDVVVADASVAHMPIQTSARPTRTEAAT